MGKILNVDLSTRRIWNEALDETLCRRFLGGYGLGAKLLYDRMPAGADGLGPDNLLGFFTGPLTGTPAIEGNRFVVVSKSPLTGTWGDANCGGTFGPHLKFAGYDGILVRGIADAPVYLLIDQGMPQLRDAEFLWGKDTNDTEDRLKDALGRRAAPVEIASIGPAGEKQSLIAAIINDKGRAAGRSGLGAVMGSKRLKAIAVSGQAPVPLFDADRVRALRERYLKRHGGAYELFVKYGTIGITAGSILSGDAPVKNWGGVGPVDFPRGAVAFDPDRVIAYQDRKYGCWRCTMACGGHMSVKESGPYRGAAHHKIEYETAGAWGPMTLTDSVPALIRINELCNRYGLDTIAAGGTAAFAVECYEAGLITAADTDGLELTWGNHAALVALAEKMGRREGFGAVLADGVKRAAERIGRGSDAYAMHVHGAEVPMHDPKYQPGLATAYKMDATPARHTQGHEDMPPLVEGWPAHDKYKWTGKGELHKQCMEMVHVVNAAGVCLFAYFAYDWQFVPDFLSAVTGWPIDAAECRLTGERIANIRHAFNLREGLNPIRFELPARVIGDPPQTAGNVRGITVDVDTQVREYCQAMDWDPETARPSEQRLRALGLDEVTRDLYAPPAEWEMPPTGRDFREERERMVETQISPRGIRDPWVLHAMRTVPRERFVPASLEDAAYDDGPLPIGEGQTISQPYVVALMTEAVEPRPGDRALEIGTGSGYAAAVLATIVSEVYTIERIAPLADGARRHLEAIGYRNVHVLHGDGTLGWPEHAPYDAIIVTAGGPFVPAPLLDQLAIGGRLIMPVGGGLHSQRLVRVTRTTADSYAREELQEVAFVPLIGKEGWRDGRPGR
jgi:aldehyde:ferredoxin oxidoreductase